MPEGMPPGLLDTAVAPQFPHEHRLRLAVVAHFFFGAEISAVLGNSNNKEETTTKFPIPSCVRFCHVLFWDFPSPARSYQRLIPRRLCYFFSQRRFGLQEIMPQLKLMPLIPNEVVEVLEQLLVHDAIRGLVDEPVQECPNGIVTGSRNILNAVWEIQGGAPPCRQRLQKTSIHQHAG